MYISVILTNTILSHNRFAPLFDTNTIDSNDDFPTIEQSLVNPVIFKKPSPTKRAPRRKPQVELTGKDIEIESLKQQLAEAKEQQKKENQRNAVLTEEERLLTRDQLQQRWAQQARERRYGPSTDRPLTEEEKTMTKTALRRRWADESHNRWVEQQRAAGHSMIRCIECGRWKRESETDHWCMRSRMQVGQRKGGQRQELLLTGNTAGIRVSKQTVLDPEYIEKQLTHYTKLKEQAALQAQPIETNPTDFEMTTEPATSSHNPSPPFQPPSTLTTPT